ncbi:helix-turn-helix domain-containing protein [Notoacmeibacter sp. MSK16QG-6]|uniref:helix-turn-helix domain-containing protein n=1 Tax=Notoacmeibacter sp. MSK16QG-6 TaxID=2957982 RepID=UPI00209E76FB|nr:helix-turn-helix transcriptional regulator [Notoacmeibacter sp. MSK16QG-6]MCP1199076.1 helix-turn-helix domain-containing protein [Notoacmeibacter sp. MSK16QG-6]
MDIFAKRLRERADQMGISNSEAARRAGLEERRYGHYIAGRREPDLTTLTKIAEVLQTTPNWLLGVAGAHEDDPEKAAFIDRFANAAKGMNAEELELFVIQAEAIAARKNAKGKEK